MGTKRKSKRISFGRRYLTLDRYMTGSFIKLFLWTFGLSALIFLLFALLSLLLGKWSIGDAFLQLSNPGGTIGEDHSAWNWIITVLLNLFGLFVLNGMVLTLLVNWVSNRKERFSTGEARYKYISKKRFAVIIGGHDMVANLANSLISRTDLDYVLIQTKRKPEDLRKEIFAAVKDKNLARDVIIYSGDRTSWHELKELDLERAQEVFIIGESENVDSTNHDALNMQCWHLITQNIIRQEEELPDENIEKKDNTDDRREDSNAESDKECQEKRKKKTYKRIPCHVMFEYQSTFTAFQFTDISVNEKSLFSFIPFSIYETWAQQVLLCDKSTDEIEYLPLDNTEGIQYDTPQRVHLIVAGMSKMGIALAIEAAHVAHYPNFNNQGLGNPRTLITFIDPNARQEMTYFMGRFRQLFQLARWRYVKAPEGIIKPTDDSWNIYDTASQISKRTNKNYPWHDPVKDADYRSPYYGGYLGEHLIDIDFEFIEGEIALPSVQNYISQASADNAGKEVPGIELNEKEVTSKTTIAICLPDSAQAMSAALYLDPTVYDNAQEILVQQNESGALVNYIKQGLTGDRISRYRILRPFGMMNKCDYISANDNILPKIVAYTYNCLNIGTTLEDKYNECDNFNDFIQKIIDFWDNISTSGGKNGALVKWSNKYCANSFPTKLRASNSEITKVKAVEIQDEDTIIKLGFSEHNRWVIEQLILGLRPVDASLADEIPIEDSLLRNKLKSINIHPDIISNEKLGVVNKYDREIVKSIPLALNIANKYNQRKNDENER